MDIKQAQTVLKVSNLSELQSTNNAQKGPAVLKVKQFVTN